MRLMVAAMAAAAILLCGPALAQQAQCGSHASVLRQLADKYSEYVVAGGVTSNDLLLEVLSSEGGANWTIVVRFPDGRACLLAAGQNWRSREPEPAGERS